MQNQSNLETQVLIVFSAWLTSRRGVLNLGEGFSPIALMCLTEEFIQWNDLRQGINPSVGVTAPPRLWFRFTPKLGKIEWKVRKFVKDLKVQLCHS